MASKEYKKAFYEKNKERYLLKAKKRYQENKEKIKARRKQLRAEETAEQRENRLAYLREWRKRPENKARARELAQSDEYKYTQYKKQSAARRGKQFSLSLNEFVKVFHSPCYLCGQEDARGIDRVDNEIGYISGNVKPCCEVCNHIKWKYELDELLNHITKIAKHRGII